MRKVVEKCDKVAPIVVGSGIGKFGKLDPCNSPGTFLLGISLFLFSYFISLAIVCVSTLGHNDDVSWTISIRKMGSQKWLQMCLTPLQALFNTPTGNTKICLSVSSSPSSIRKALLPASKSLETIGAYTGESKGRNRGQRQ